MSIETGVLINKQGEPIHWHLPPGRSGGALPDSRDLWGVIWENRDNILGFAHSHPGSGETGPSWEDLTTFSAIERGLGRRLIWWITSADRLAVLHWEGPDKHQYALGQIVPHLEARYPWVTELRRYSNYPDSTPRLDYMVLDGRDEYDFDQDELYYPLDISSEEQERLGLTLKRREAQSSKR